MKQCSKCKTNFPITFFRKRKASKDGLNIYCKHCHSAMVRKWKINNPEKVKETREKYKTTGQQKHRASHYGITPEEYDAMLLGQGGCCLICGISNRKLVIDHCHNTGLIRGILCLNCNAGIGMLNDDLKLLHQAIWYLELTQDEA